LLCDAIVSYTTADRQTIRRFKVQGSKFKAGAQAVTLNVEPTGEWPVYFRGKL